MIISVQIPESIENRLKEEAAKRGHSLKGYIECLIVREALHPTMPAEPIVSTPSTFATYEEWSKAFREWVDSHAPVEHFVDDSRESIYAGRGE